VTLDVCIGRRGQRLKGRCRLRRALRDDLVCYATKFSVGLDKALMHALVQHKITNSTLSIRIRLQLRKALEDNLSACIFDLSSCVKPAGRIGFLQKSSP